MATNGMSQPPAIRRLVMCVLQQEIDHPILGKVNAIKQWLVDAQTGLSPSDEEIHEHFRNLTATGIMVKRRYDPNAQGWSQPADITTTLPDNLPHYGVIDGLTPTHVILIPPHANISLPLPPRDAIRVEGYPPTITNQQVARIPRTEFHNLYEID